MSGVAVLRREGNFRKGEDPQVAEAEGESRDGLGALVKRQEGEGAHSGRVNLRELRCAGEGSPRVGRPRFFVLLFSVQMCLAV